MWSQFKKFNTLSALKTPMLYSRHSMKISDVFQNIVFHLLFAIVLLHLYSGTALIYPLLSEATDRCVRPTIGYCNARTGPHILTHSWSYSVVLLYISIESLYYNHYWSKEADVWCWVDWWVRRLFVDQLESLLLTRSQLFQGLTMVTNMTSNTVRWIR